MHKSKCPVCGSSHTVKNGKRKGSQLYKCADCGYQFRNNSMPDDLHLWKSYQENKQTVKELSDHLSVSESTVKRHLRNVSIEWVQPPLSGGGFVHLDATYWGHNWGIMLALDDASGNVLYLEFIRNETNADYDAAVRSIENSPLNRSTRHGRRNGKARSTDVRCLNPAKHSIRTKDCVPPCTA